MTTYVDLELAEGLDLPYVAGAEAWLAGLDPAYDAAWQGAVAAFGELTLEPLFGELEDLADLVAQATALGNQPPTMTVWFGVACPDDPVEEIRAALYALPFVLQAVIRRRPVPAGVVSWGTNPRTPECLQFQTAPAGVNAVHAWQVHGGTGRDARVCDVEDGWSFDHEELATITYLDGSSIWGSPSQDALDHGTASVGIVAAPDNGVGIVGLAPHAGIALVSEDRGGVLNLPAAILLGARALGDGGILLLEVAEPFFGALDQPDVMAEFHPATQVAIRLATALGVTVIEPAGNGGLDVDTLPATAHLSPDSPTFSGAVVVGAGQFDRTTGAWSRAPFTVRGRRVDCFADGTRALAPWRPPDGYIEFSGTSSASAIIAGVAASMQGMALANLGRTFTPAEIRAQLGDFRLGTVMTGIDISIGPMPDLRLIAEFNGFPRIIPPGVAAGPDGVLLVVTMDPDNLLYRLVQDPDTGWTVLPLDQADQLEMVPGQPAVLATARPDRTVFEVIALSGGVHHMWWDTAGGSGKLVRLTERAAVSQSCDLAAVRTSDDTLVVIGVGPGGRLVSMVGDPVHHPDQRLSTPLEIFGVTFRRCAGPVAVTHGPGSVTVVAIDDDGTLQWASGSTFATIGDGWTARGPDPSGLAFEPGVRPALLAMDDGVVMVAAVGIDGVLRATTLDTTTGVLGTAFESWEQISPDVAMGTTGPLALGTASDNVVLLGVDTSANLRVTVRAWAGGTYSPMEIVGAWLPADDMGGVVAVQSTDRGLLAIALHSETGQGHVTTSFDGIEWTDPVGFL